MPYDRYGPPPSAPGDHYAGPPAQMDDRYSSGPDGYNRGGYNRGRARGRGRGRGRGGENLADRFFCMEITKTNVYNICICFL